MFEEEPAGLESRDKDDCTECDPSLGKRDARALTEAMTVLPEGGDIYTVVGENGSTYTVDGREERCTCPDAEHNLPTDDGRETCKHIARVQYATGKREIPSWVSFAAVDPLFGEHVSGEETVAVATDGGTTDDECSECIEGVAPCFDCYRKGKSFPEDGKHYQANVT